MLSNSTPNSARELLARPSHTTVSAAGTGLSTDPGHRMQSWRRVEDPAQRRAIHRHNLGTWMLPDPRRVDDLATEVAFRAVEADRLRGCLRAWIAKKITAILSLEGVSTFFVPAKRKVSPSTLGFDWAEVSSVVLGPDAEPLPIGRRAISGIGIVVPPPDAVVVAAVEQFDKVDGILSAAVIDRGLGRTLFAKGEPLDEGLYLALLHALSLAELSEGSIGEDVILTSDRRIYLTRIVPSRPSIALFAVLERDESNLGMARVLMKNAASSIPTLEA